MNRITNSQKFRWYSKFERLNKNFMKIRISLIVMLVIFRISGPVPVWRDIMRLGVKQQVTKVTRKVRRRKTLNLIRFNDSLLHGSHTINPRIQFFLATRAGNYIF